MIAILGPTFPWKGGIAHHTNNLINTLVFLGEPVRVYTFSKQYPNFFYPGKTQKEPAGSVNPLKIGTKEILDPINPITWFKTASSILQDKPTHCIFQYWHPFFIPCFIVIAYLLRRKRVKTVCIIQTLVPHDRHLIDIFLIRLLFFQIDLAIFDKSMEEQFLNLFPSKLFKLLPLPVFDQFGPPIDMETSRQKLGLPEDKDILLFFGFIREYKGLDILISALPSVIKKKSNAHLLIVGECFGDFSPYENLVKKLHLEKYVTSHIKYVPNEEIPYWFGSCDLLVMPYRHIINSGVESIGKIYAKKTLLTLGVSSEELASQILLTLDRETGDIQTSFGWHQYVIELTTFLQDPTIS